MRPLALELVLAATDLSDADLPALRTAVALARLAGAQLHVVHAVTEGETRDSERLEAQMREADPDSEILPATTLRRGRPEGVISDVARRIGADVIVLGPHGEGDIHRVGGTAYRVAAEAERPCLVLPGEMKLPLGRILVPVDASEAARGAMAVALTWASALRRRQAADGDGTALTVLHVSAPEADAMPADEVLETAVAAAGERTMRVARVRIDRAAERSDDPARAIIDRANAEKVDLIVIGTRAVLGPDAELGSVSSAVVQGTSCPLLLVPPRVWREEAAEPVA